MPSSDEIRFARESRCLTQAQAARLVGYSRETWNLWERGKAVVPAGVWARFIQLNTGGPMSKSKLVGVLVDYANAQLNTTAAPTVMGAIAHLIDTGHLQQFVIETFQKDAGLKLLANDSSVGGVFSK